MLTIYAPIFLLLPWTVLSESQLPVAKCQYPLPSSPGLNISAVVGDTFKYIYTPNSMLFKAVDSITMMIKRIPNMDNVYSEVLKARSVFGTQTKMNFNVTDLGNGILKKITKAGEKSYLASIVGMKGDICLLYVCSDQGEDKGDDLRYVIARPWVDPAMVKHPDVLFRSINLKYNFRGKFRKLPQRWLSKLLSKKKTEPSVNSV
uniref:NtA domain-containing protein n=1 Tax=Homalodisca liturata TaxID=320908 RepID=A0A1B6INJ6_9HEMI